MTSTPRTAEPCLSRTTIDGGDTCTGRGNLPRCQLCPASTTHYDRPATPTPAHKTCAENQATP